MNSVVFSLREKRYRRRRHAEQSSESPLASESLLLSPVMPVDGHPARPAHHSPRERDTTLHYTTLHYATMPCVAVSSTNSSDPCGHRAVVVSSGVLCVPAADRRHVRNNCVA